MHIVTETDPKSGAILASNRYNTEFPGRTVFMDVSETKRILTGDRNEFIGQNGAVFRPAAMKNTRLTGNTGAGLDPCAALQVQISIGSNQEKEIVFYFGCAKNQDEAKKLVQKTREPMQAKNEFKTVKEYWNRELGTVRIETPDREIDILTNGWFLYQTLSSRFFGRSGYYQSGGAFGFRDQIQDCFAILYSDPYLVREHILRCAAHQFKDGDVLHWWHPPVERGVRTICSDDLLWLPLLVKRYVDMTADTGILEEKINYLEGRPLSAGEGSYYDKQIRSEEKGSIYEHCVRAIKYGIKYGSHGLPLMGGGDWNDGMNLVGAEGKGESVWLAFFLIYTLTHFKEAAKIKADKELEDYLDAEILKLKRSTKEHSWDGEWYLRAYYDNGEPLGSSKNSECMIDSISQSWAVISGSADTERSRKALLSAEKYLIDDKNGLIKLLHPSFDSSLQEPGYIKGYLAGVRENGGQYTHAALWLIIAFALN
jgi:cellobiose phosphorylase